MGLKFSKRIATPASSDKNAASNPEATTPGKAEPEQPVTAMEPQKLVVEVGPPVPTDVCLPSGNCVVEEKPSAVADVSASTGDAEIPVDKAEDPLEEKPTDATLEVVPEPKAPVIPDITIPSPCTLPDPVAVDVNVGASAADGDKEDCDESEGNAASPLEALKQEASDITQGIVTGILEDISKTGSDAVSGLLEGEAQIPGDTPILDINTTTELM